VAGFIPTAQSDAFATRFTGDDRDFNPYGEPGVESSRFWAWIDAETGKTLRVEFHPTCVVGDGCSGPKPADCGPLNNCFKSRMNKDGSITVEYKAICSATGANAAACLLTAAGTVTLIPNGEGSFDTTERVDKFPNLELYYWDRSDPAQPRVYTLRRIQNFSESERRAGWASALTGSRMLWPQYRWPRTSPTDQVVYPGFLPIRLR
jgi:hypothetical protein